MSSTAAESALNQLPTPSLRRPGVNDHSASHAAHAARATQAGRGAALARPAGDRGEGGDGRTVASLAEAGPVVGGMEPGPAQRTDAPAQTVSTSMVRLSQSAARSFIAACSAVSTERSQRIFTATYSRR